MGDEKVQSECDHTIHPIDANLESNRLDANFGVDAARDVCVPPPATV